MSSGTSTDSSPFESDATRDGLQPWQFFVLAALLSATAALFLTRAEGVMAVVFLAILIGAAALVGLAGLRTVRPLVTPDDRLSSVGGRTRETLEREKMLALRTLKELEFDRAMGKISNADFDEMSGRLRARAGRLIRQLDAGEGHRARIEEELARRLQQPATATPTSAEGQKGSWTVVVRMCAACETPNDNDARFCKSCGAKL